jgi:hypothetical protein
MLDPQSAAEGLYPLPETGLERLRLDPVEDAFEGVVRGNTIGQLQEAPQPVAPFTPEGFNLLPVLGAGYDSTEGNNDDILQIVQAAVTPTRVL